MSQIRTLHFVFLDTAASDRPDAKSLSPARQDLIDAEAYAATLNVNLQVHLVDPNYRFAMRRKAPSIDADLVATYPRNVEIYPGTFEEWEQERKRTGDTILQDDDVAYISATPTSSYELMDRLEMWFPEKRWFISGPLSGTSSAVTDFLKGWLPGLPTAERGGTLASPYNLYRGGALTGPQPILDLIAIRLYLARAANQIQHWLALGYHTPTKPSNYVVPPSWVLNVEIAPVKGFIGYYGLIPTSALTVADRDPQMEMRESGDYRRRLLNLMAAPLGHLAINNKLIAADRVVALGGWLSVSAWKSIQEAALAWDMRPYAPTGATGGAVAELAPNTLVLPLLRDPPAAGAVAPTAAIPKEGAIVGPAPQHPYFALTPDVPFVPPPTPSAGGLPPPLPR